MGISFVLFDLDDTLYPAGAGLTQEIEGRMTRYVAEHLGMSYAAADALRRQYYEYYGSSIRGLFMHHALTIDPSDYLAFVHDLPVENYLSRNADLARWLECIRAKKAIFTNAPADYAERVLTALGVRNQFAHIFDIGFCRYFGKPNPLAYVRVQQALHARADQLLMIDHRAANLAPARQLQWRTVWVRGDPSLQNGKADYTVDNLGQATQVFYELGVMDEKHRAIAQNQLASWAWAQRA